MRLESVFVRGTGSNVRVIITFICCNLIFTVTITGAVSSTIMGITLIE